MGPMRQQYQPPRATESRANWPVPGTGAPGAATGGGLHWAWTPSRCGIRPRPGPARGKDHGRPSRDDRPRLEALLRHYRYRLLTWPHVLLSAGVAPQLGPPPCQVRQPLLAGIVIFSTPLASPVEPISSSTIVRGVAQPAHDGVPTVLL